jgi:hypothetical protein
VANEYRIHHLSTEVLDDPTSEARVTSLSVETTTDDPGTTRVSSLSVELPTNDPGVGRVSNLSVEVLDNAASQVRMTAFYVEVLRTITIQDDTPQQLALTTDPAELNPYRPDIPVEIEDQSRVLYYFMREQAETLRKQHNLIQMGDTTYPWDVLTEFDLSPRWTLGAVGRFYHASYGLIQARYVKFDHITDTIWFGSPAGSLLVAESVDWVVTNDFTKSGADLVQGIIGGYRLPLDGEYGWLIINGVNPQELQILDTYAHGDSIIWSATGVVSTEGAGTSLGYVWGQPQEKLLPGLMYVNLGGFSVAAIQAALADDFLLVNQQLNSLGDRVDDLEALDSADIEELQDAVAALQGGLLTEERARRAADSTLNARINTILSTDFIRRVEYTNRQNVINLELANLDGRITSLTTTYNAQVLSFNTQISVINGRLYGVETGLTSALTLISTLNDTVSNSLPVWAPVVVGSPPILVYDANDELIFVKKDPL